MSFLLDCPNCGPRDVNEFSCAGEVTVRPKTSPTLRELTSYIYFRRNVAGVQQEWWLHRSGCGEWFIAERDTRTNEVHWTRPVDEVFGGGAGAAATGADGSGVGP